MISKKNAFVLASVFFVAIKNRKIWTLIHIVHRPSVNTNTNETLIKCNRPGIVSEITLMHNTRAGLTWGEGI